MPLSIETAATTGQLHNKARGRSIAQEHRQLASNLMSGLSWSLSLRSSEIVFRSHGAGHHGNSESTRMWAVHVDLILSSNFSSPQGCIPVPHHCMPLPLTVVRSLLSVYATCCPSRRTILLQKRMFFVHQKSMSRDQGQRCTYSTVVHRSHRCSLLFHPFKPWSLGGISDG